MHLPVPVLILGLGLIFFMVGRMGQYLVWMLETAFIMQKFFVVENCLHSIKGLFCFLYYPTSQEAVDAQETGRDTGDMAQLIPYDPRDIPYQMGVMLSIQKWGKKEWGMFRMMVLIFTKSQLGMRKTCFPRDYWIPACLWESVNHLTIQNTPAVLQFPSSQVITLVDFLTSSLSKKSLIFLHSFLFSAKY